MTFRSFKDTVRSGIHFQDLRLDFDHNGWVALVTFALGASLPLHHHTGHADLNTLTIRVVVDSLSAAQGPPCRVTSMVPKQV
jgi:anti-sigma factor ChrR (cupin superfamily)